MEWKSALSVKNIPKTNVCVGIQKKVDSLRGRRVGAVFTPPPTKPQEQTTVNKDLTSGHEHQPGDRGSASPATLF